MECYSKPLGLLAGDKGTAGEDENMVKLMGRMNLYREELKAMARSLDQEGLSQTAIGKELEMDHRTIGRWLCENNCHATQGILPKGLNNGHNALSARPHPHYLVLCQAVEKFRPPDGITFPLIIADPPWNALGHGLERATERRSVARKELTMDKDSIREVEMKGLTLGAELPTQKVYEEICPECPFKTGYCEFRMKLAIAKPELVFVCKGMRAGVRKSN